MLLIKLTVSYGKLHKWFHVEISRKSKVQSSLKFIQIKLNCTHGEASQNYLRVQLFYWILKW